MKIIFFQIFKHIDYHVDIYFYTILSRYLYRSCGICKEPEHSELRKKWALSPGCKSIQLSYYTKIQATSSFAVTRCQHRSIGSMAFGPGCSSRWYVSHPRLPHSLASLACRHSRSRFCCNLFPAAYCKERHFCV